MSNVHKAFPIEWRRRESNPRPKSFSRSFYMFSRSIILADIVLRTTGTLPAITGFIFIRFPVEQNLTILLLQRLNRTEQVRSRGDVVT